MTDTLAPICYTYDKQTGVYTGQDIAYESPLEPGVWLFPEPYTLIVPPTYEKSQIPVFGAGQWTIVPDYRGQTWYDKNNQPVLVELLGNPADNGLTVEITQTPENLKDLKTLAFTQILQLGNAITRKITDQYADAEQRSWIAQEQEARIVKAGQTLPDSAILPDLATLSNLSLIDFANKVIAKADLFRKITVVIATLRVGAEGLLSDSVTTIQQLSNNTDALKKKVNDSLQNLGLTL